MPDVADRATIRGWIEESTREGLAVSDALPDTLAEIAEVLGIFPSELRMWIFDQEAGELSGGELIAWARRHGFNRSESGQVKIVGPKTADESEAPK